MKMLEKFKVYIVNLKLSKARKEQILRELNKQKIKNFELIEAVDGNKLNKEEIYLHTFKNKKNFNPWGPELTNSQIGCIKSYKNL